MSRSSAPPASVGLPRNASLLDALAPLDRRRFVDFGTVRRLRAGDSLFRQGEPSTCAYVLTDGELAATVSADGRAVLTLPIAAPEILDAPAMLEPGGVREASVVATTEVTVRELGRDAWTALRGEEPAIASKVLSAIVSDVTRRLRAVDERTARVLASRAAPGGEGGGPAR